MCGELEDDWSRNDLSQFYPDKCIEFESFMNINFHDLNWLFLFLDLFMCQNVLFTIHSKCVTCIKNILKSKINTLYGQIFQNVRFERDPVIRSICRQITTKRSYVALNNYKVQLYLHNLHQFINSVVSHKIHCYVCLTNLTLYF